MSQLPEGIRIRAFAAAELLLDLIYVARQFVDADLKSVLIYCCASEATMRPMVAGPPAARVHVEAPVPPPEARGWISRRALADRTGLARETVRRKAQVLLDRGLLEEDSKGRMRVTPMLMEPQAQKLVEDIYAAVRRFEARACAPEH